MSADLTFEMGKHVARFPTDRRYSDNHQWLLPVEGDRWRVGLTSFSVRLLLDVYFLDWTVEKDAPVRYKEEVGQVESSKAVSGLYAPTDGRLAGFNEAVVDDPALINADCYDAGWLYGMTVTGTTLSPEEYVESVAANWQKTQGLIKGQMNTS